MSAGQVSSGRTDSTASWLDPESNHTSRMLFSRSKVEWPQAEQVSPEGRKSPVGRSYHESAPEASKTDAAFSTSADVSSGSPQFLQSTAGIGTPQTRCLETHQSGRFAIML